MTADKLHALVPELRAEGDASLAILHAVDFELLTANSRTITATRCVAGRSCGAMTKDEVTVLRETGCLGGGPS